MNKFIAITICVIVFFTTMVAGEYIKTNNNRTKAVQVQMVQMVCDIAGRENNLYNQQACSDVQDQTNTEYICSHSGTSCWVESL